MKKNDYLDLEIKGMTNEGNGVGKAPDGMAVFVPFTAVGDKIYCKIVKAEKSYAYGIVDSVLSPSENRCDNDCEAFYKCGGCSFRHFTYEQELSIKQDFVKASFERIAKLSPKFEEILGCDKVDSYRNKAQLPVASVNGKAVAGFFSKRSHRVMPLSDCKLQPSEFFKIVNEVLCYQNEKGLSCYDETTGKGLLRHIYIRRGEHTGETMLCLVVTKKTSDYDELAELVVSKFPQIVSVVLNINSKNTNVVLGTQCHTIFGKDTITDIMCKNKIEISPLSFYQVNTLQAEKLYEIAGEYAELSENDTLLDLYCGAGTIGLSMASRVKKLIGVEIVAPAIENAKHNAKINGIKNAEFICADAGKATQSLIERGEKIDVIIADPARKGCDKLSLDSMIKLAPRRIVMVSCNHATAARDVKYLTENGYNVEKVRTVDLFPRTTHVECVVLMTRNDDSQNSAVVRLN